jgi:hypothetical protein
MFFCDSAVSTLIIHSAAASPAAQESKPFKIGVAFDSRTLYLTEGEEASESIDKGMVCKISATTEISCGSKNLGLGFEAAHPFWGTIRPTELTKGNKNWAIGADNVLSWKDDKGKDVHLSLKKFEGATTSKKVYAEQCSTLGHGDGPAFISGVAKAYFV